MSTKTSHKAKSSSLKSKNTTFLKDFGTLKTLLEGAKRVLISTHSLPDGDGLGAELALYHYLKKSKKTCRIYNPDAIPKRYKFLDPKGVILLGPGEVELWDRCDLWIILDTNDPRRLGKVWTEMSLRCSKIVFFDHHPGFSDELAIAYPPNAMVVSDTESGSIGELLYHLFQELNLTKLSADIALGLYVSVMTDTNSFRYARTTELSHLIAGEMISLGVNPEEIYQAIFSSKEISHLQLLGQMLQNVKISAGGKLAWMELSLETRKKHRASADDTLSFMNLLLLLKDAEVVCLFREEDDNQVRVSMRSKGQIVINKIAMELGGGGHEYAAGMAVNVSIEQAVSTVTRRIESQISSFEKFGK